MSSEVSPESDRSGSAEPPKSKKRRTPGACDICKKRKMPFTGNSGQQPGNRCTNCTNSGLDCTHAEVMKVSNIRGCTPE
ncbi:hypothetical protein B0H10DRAFT_1782493 [Mycena sp. CBHHK59/15]|nr:hypothetical protein B0H10DRAFT_1782493 [Mycena sp. CBHHK59/15]